MRFLLNLSVKSELFGLSIFHNVVMETRSWVRKKGNQSFMKFTWNLRVFPLKFFFSRLFDSVKKTKTDAFGLLESHNAFLEIHSYTLRWFINNPLEMYKGFYRNCSFLDCFTPQNQNLFGLTIFLNAVLETHLNEFEKKNWSFMRFTLNVREFPLKFSISRLFYSVKIRTFVVY